jgi:hypothetical protein
MTAVGGFQTCISVNTAREQSFPGEGEWSLKFRKSGARPFRAGRRRLCHAARW